MPDKKISDLVDGGSPQNSDEFVVARAGDNFKLAWSSLSHSQSVQTQNAVDVTLSGNTAGALALVSSGTLTFAGGNNITLSQNGNAVTISGANAAGAQTAISGISASDTLYTSGTVRITGVGGGVTVSSNTGQRIDISVAAQSVQPETQTFIAGVSASDTLYTSGNVRITGVGGGITVSSNTGQRIDLSVAAQSVQPETQTFIGGISASNTLYTSGSVRFTGSQAATVRSGTGQLVIIDVPVQSTQVETQTFVGGLSASDTVYTSGTIKFSGVGGGITVSSNTGQRIDLSVAAQSVQPETQTFIGGISASNTLYTSGSVRFTGSQAVTVRSGTGQLVVIDAPAQTAQTGISGIANSQTTYTSGTVSLSELGAITIRSTTGNQYQFSVAAQSAQTGISGVANSQTTYTSGTVSLSELGAITIRSTTGNQYQFSVNSQTVQTQNMVAISATNTLYSSGTVLFTGSNMITVKSSGAGQTVILDATQSVQTQGILNVALSNVGNTSGDTGINSGTRMVLAGGNNITLSASTAANATTITISAPNLGAGAMSAGVSTGGNTAGATGVTGTQLVLVGSNNITLSQTTGANGGTVSIIGPAAGAFSAGVSTGGNTAGSTGVTGTRLVFVGTGEITLSQATDANGGTVSISNGLNGTISRWPGMPQSTVSAGLASYFATAATRTSMTAYVAPFAIEQAVSVNEMRVPVYASITSANSASNWSWTAGNSMGIYTLTGATLSLLSSFSHKQQVSYQSAANSTNASATWSASWGSGTDLSASLSLSTNNAGVTGFWSSISSMKLYPMFSGAVSVSPGQYFNAWVFSSATAGSLNASLLGVGVNVAVSSQQAAQDIGLAVTLTTAIHPLGGLISMTQTNTAMPASFLSADMSTSGAAALAMNRSVYFNMHSRFA